MPQILPVQNIAPLKPLFDAAEKESTVPTYIESGLQELFKDLMKRDEQTFREVIETTEITSNFAQGKQIFQQTTNGWRIQNIRRVNPNKITAINNMQYYLTQNIENFVSSNPDIEPSEEFRQIQYKDAVKKAKAVWNGYETRWYKPWFNQQEALHCVLSGTYIESVQYDQLAAGAMAFKEIWGEVEVPVSEGQGKCFACGFQGNAADMMPNALMPQCPECGSYDIHVSPAISQIMPSVTALQPIQMGDLRLRLIPIQSARFDVKKRAEESGYFIERIAVRKSRLDHILGKKLRLGTADKDRGLKSLDVIQTSGNTLYGQDNSVVPTDDEDVIIDRVSLSPEDYAHIKTHEYQDVNGETQPAGKMLDTCQGQPCTVLGLNGLKVILGIYPGIHHSYEISSGVNHMRLESGIGRGMEDNVEVQKRFTRNDNQMLKAGETGATPAHFHVEGAIDRRHVQQIGFPGVSIPIKREVVEALGTTDLIRQLSPSSTAGTFFNYTYDLLARFGQMTAHAPDLSNSLFNQKSGGTATEARISDSNAERLSTPLLQIKADVRLGTAHNTMKAYPRHFKGVSRFHSFGTTKQNMAVGEQIKGEDVDPNIEFVVVKDSQRPKTKYSQQSGLAASAQVISLFGGVDVLKANQPDLLHNVLTTFDVDLDIDDYDTMEDLCFGRLQQAVMAVKSGVPPIIDILNIVLKPQITPFEKDHPGKLEWFQDYLDCPEGVKMPENERAAIFALIIGHRTGGVIQAGNLMQAANEVQVIGNQPVIDQQREQAEIDAGQESEAKLLEADNQAASDERSQNFEREKMASEQGFQASQSEAAAQLEREKMANVAKV